MTIPMVSFIVSYVFQKVENALFFFTVDTHPTDNSALNRVNAMSATKSLGTELSTGYSSSTTIGTTTLFVPLKTYFRENLFS